MAKGFINSNCGNFKLTVIVFMECGTGPYTTVNFINNKILCRSSKVAFGTRQKLSALNKRSHKCKNSRNIGLLHCTHFSIIACINHCARTKVTEYFGKKNSILVCIKNMRTVYSIKTGFFCKRQNIINLGLFTTLNKIVQFFYIHCRNNLPVLLNGSILSHKEKELVCLECNCNLLGQKHGRNIIRTSCRAPANARKNWNKAIGQNNIKRISIKAVNFSGSSKIKAVYNSLCA